MTPDFRSGFIGKRSSGTCSLKLARRVTGKPGVIAFRRAFHGRTLAATSLTTAKGKYREGYERGYRQAYNSNGYRRDRDNWR